MTMAPLHVRDSPPGKIDRATDLWRSLSLYFSVNSVCREYVFKDTSCFRKVIVVTSHDFHLNGGDVKYAIFR